MSQPFIHDRPESGFANAMRLLVALILFSTAFQHNDLKYVQ